MSDTVSAELDEARYLIAKFSDRFSAPNSDAEARAVEPIFKALFNLNDVANLQVELLPGLYGGALAVSLPYVSRTKKVIVLRNAGRIEISVKANGEIGLRKVDDIWFNRTTGQYESTVEDVFHVPVPGAPKRYKPAYIVVLEQVLDLLGSELSTESSR